MEHEIINCYELDIRQDIPAEIKLIKSNNESLLRTNQSFKIILIAIGLGVIVFVVYQNSKTKKENEDK